ncbi:MAG: TBC domain-containing protein [archaeon]|nr:TBC domain-containing protein [archaeon]
MNYYWDLAGIIIDCKLVTLLLSKYIPDLYIYFKKNKFDLTVNNFIHKWLVCLFTQSFDMNVSDIILDYFFIEGNIVLIKSCLGVFSVLRKELLKMTDFEDFYSLLNTKTLDIKDPGIILYFLSVRKFEFDNDFLDKCREELAPPILADLKEEKRKKILRAKKQKKLNPKLFVVNGMTFRTLRPCNPNWPFCWYDNSFQDVPQYLILSGHNKPFIKPYIMDDYYYYKVNKYPDERNKGIDEYFISGDKDVLCERKKHFCDDKKLIDNSIAMLEEGQTHSEINEEKTEPEPEEDNNVNVYSRLENDKQFAMVWNKLEENFEVKKITEKELEPFINIKK